MRRPLFNIAAVFSLVLFVATGVGWVRSHIHQDTVSRTGPERRYFTITHAHGMLLVGWGEYRQAFYAVTRFTTRPVLPRAAYEEYWQPRLGGFALHRKPQEGAFKGSRIWELVLPYWALLCATAVAPARLIASRIRSARRRAAGHCPTCGYDCCATPQRCPECGSAADGRANAEV